MRFFLFIFIVTASFAQNDFRSSNWGVTRAQAMKKEKKKLVLNHDGLVYEDKVMSMNAYVYYVFNQNNNFYRGIYFIFRYSSRS